jgi:hypothetical protein
MAPPPRRSSAAAAAALLALSLSLATLPSPVSGFGDASTTTGWSSSAATTIATTVGRPVCDGCAGNQRGEATFLASLRFPGRVYVTDRWYSNCYTYNFDPVQTGKLDGTVYGRDIWTLAGTYGQSGYAGDGGLANASTVLLNNPLGFAEDSVGNVFINDYGNRKIRRVDAVTGIITTYADTSFMRFPNSMTVDTSTDTLYVADVGARPRNASQTSADPDYTLTRGSEQGGLYSYNATTGLFTLFAGGPDTSGVARPSGWEWGPYKINTRMTPFKIWYIAARNAIAYLDPLNSVVVEMPLTGQWTGLKTLIAGNGAGSATSTNPYDAPAVGSSTYGSAGAPPTAFSTSGTALPFGWGTNLGPTAGSPAGFGISSDGARIVVCARNFIVGGSVSFSIGQSNQGTLTNVAVPSLGFYPYTPSNVNYLEDCQPDYDGLGVFYLINTPSSNFQLVWRRPVAPAGKSSVDGSGFGASVSCPAGSYAPAPTPTTCLYGPSKLSVLVSLWMGRVWSGDSSCPSVDAPSSPPPSLPSPLYHFPPSRSARAPPAPRPARPALSTSTPRPRARARARAALRAIRRTVSGHPYSSPLPRPHPAPPPPRSLPPHPTFRRSHWQHGLLHLPRQHLCALVRVRQHGRHH